MFAMIGQIFSFFTSLIGRAKEIITRDKQLSDMQAQLEEALRLMRENRTDNERKERALSRLESDVAMLMELVTSGPSDAVLLTDSHGEAYWLSPSYISITGLSISQAKHEGWLRAVIPTDRHEVQQAWELAVENNSVFVMDYTYQHIRDGTKTMVHCDAQPVFRSDAGQQMVGWVGRLTLRK